MYKVEVNTIEEYFAAGRQRRHDLEALDKLICRVAPKLERWFYAGVQAGEPGMRMKMIGYGITEYRRKSGDAGKWPIIGLALQKNYLSVYIAAHKDGFPMVDLYKDRLGATRTGINNFSFVSYKQLNQDALVSLLKDIDDYAVATG